MAPSELEPYLEHLRALPFVRGVRVTRKGPHGTKHADYELAVRTAGEQARLLVELKKSHLSPEVVERWASATDKSGHHLLLAPAIGQQLGDRLEGLGLSFMDRAGNCYLNLSGKHVARIQGKRAEPTKSSEKALRAPAYRALFALLADPKLVAAPVRTIADAAGVSRQAALDIRPRLEGLGWLYTTKTRFRWAPRGASKALDLFIAGYATTLRPRLTLGRYRTPGSNPGEIEDNIAAAVKSSDRMRWGGGAAAMRLTGYYRGERTILHMDKPPAEFFKRIRAIQDRNGPLEILSFPGPLARAGTSDDTAHPLLVYAELMVEGHDRASEVANQILGRWFPPENYE